jgi:HD-GYP domain-containing protein (c-di-GMP phosphodiesterase class II)
MSIVTLTHPVHTLDNRLLLPAATNLTPEALGSLIESNTADSEKPCRLLDYGSVINDMMKCLSQPPYSEIFSDKDETSGLLDLMATVYLIPSVLRSLDYFRMYDFHTYRHILLVFALSTLLAKDLNPDYKDRIREAATGPTHDCGKICIPQRILRKTAPLTRREKKIVDHHAAAGYVLLSYYLKDSNNLSAIVARDHHERKDGSGQPRGIRLDDLMVEIVAASDVYDALISPRPYRPVSYDNRTALEEITGMAERGEIGWDVVKALVAHNRKSKPDFRDSSVSGEKRGAPPPGNVHGIVIDDDIHDD